MLRKIATTLVVLSILLTAVPAGVAGQSLGAATEDPEVIEYSAGPSFVVELKSSESVDKLERWSNGSDRRIVEVDHATDIATVAGPKGLIDSDAGFVAQLRAGTLLSTPLEGKAYVESVSPNYRLELAQPLTERDLANVSEYDAPESADSGYIFSEEMPHDGMAFSEDANRTIMSESRQHIGADNVSATGAGETIAVVDTGFAAANGRIAGNGTPGSQTRILDSSRNVISNQTVATDGLEAIEDGSDSKHGTWVASAAAGDPSGTKFDGVAPQADLLILKALADDGSGSVGDIVRAVRYAAQENASVISMSLGSQVYSEALDRAVADAHESGSVVVVAAGNSRQSARWVASPADSDEAITVGATNGEAPSTAESAYFSQVGPDPGTTDDSGAETAGAKVDVAAPGMSTVAKVATTDGVVENKTLSGTSMAQPMVAGSIAVALASNDWSPDETAGYVRQSARPVPRAGETEVGSGMVAVDHLVDGTEPDTEQATARTDGAVTRDETYRAASRSSGGWLTLR